VRRAALTALLAAALLGAVLAAPSGARAADHRDAPDLPDTLASPLVYALVAGNNTTTRWLFAQYAPR
jgi:hypothetical protein